MLSFVFTNTYAAEKQETRKIAGAPKNVGVMCAESPTGWEDASKELNEIIHRRNIMGTQGTTYPIVMSSVSTPVLGFNTGKSAAKPFVICVSVSE